MNAKKKDAHMNGKFFNSYPVVSLIILDVVSVSIEILNLILDFLRVPILNFLLDIISKSFAHL